MPRQRALFIAIILAAIGGFAFPAAAALGAIKALPVSPNSAAVQMVAHAKTAAALKAAFLAWAKRDGVKNAALAIVDDGAITDSVSLGSDTPTKPEPVASESKSVTAMCILRLVEAGKLSFSDTLGQRLRDYFAANPPHEAAAKNITLAALLTHSSRIRYDPTQGSALEQFKPYDKTAYAKELAAALAKPLGKPKYFYNNINYDALGLVIATVTGKSYEDYCRQTVLVPAGITDAKLNPQWMVMGSFGGWMLSADDEVKFLAYFDPASRLISTLPRTWPKKATGGGVSYSLGTLMRPSGSWFNFWHFGSWSSGSSSFGAYFARWSNGVGVSATYQPTISDKAGGDLDTALAAAGGS
jgi:CubicO group peptidase (beta-lactamase class C family)